MTTRINRLKRAGPIVAAAALALAAPAAFGQATRLRVTQADAQFLHLAEVQALSGANNVADQANGGVAAASSEGFGGVAPRANDGNTNGDYFGGNSVYHSANAAIGEFWEVAFSNPATVDTINIFGRSDCCHERDNNLTVQLFDAGGNTIFTRSNVVLSPDAGQGLVVIAVPEPSVFAAGALGAAGLLLRRRRR